MPLFERYPGTRGLPHVRLGSFPTPVMRANELASLVGARGAWVKRDDMSAVRYGGNKVRKLEFLLGSALAAGATDVITFGAAGSNHALATAIYGGAHGLRVHSMLTPQHDAPYVGRNLRAASAVGGDLHYFDDRRSAERAAAALRTDLRTRTGREPLIIPFGGTTPGSTAGFVNAAFELADQVEAGLLPEPDTLFVTLGSMGTAAGLALGLRAARLRTRVVAVQVIADSDDDARRLVDLIAETQAMLRGADPSFPVFDWSGNDIEVVPGFVGSGYAVPTAQGSEAIAVASATAGLHLDGTYTGKTLAALLDRGRAGRLAGSDVVFWNTYNSRDIDDLVEAGAPASIPAGLREYATDEGSSAC